MEGPSNHQLCPDSDDDIFDSVNRAFRIDMVRDKILDYVIHDRENVLISNVRSCRLVTKSFHKSVTRILSNCREPLFRFHLTWRNCTTDKPVGQRDSTLVDEFSKLTTSSSLYQQVPPHSIRVTHPGFTDKNLEQNLFALLTNFACDLVELDLTFSDQKKPIPLIANVSFPKLRVLKVLDYEYKDKDDGDHYLQIIINACENLQSFAFKYDHWKLFLSSNYFLLPSSITAVDLDCSLLRDRDQLPELTKKSLPNLRELKLHVMYSLPGTDVGGVITDILNNVRCSLKKFRVKVENIRKFGLRGQLSTIKLPLMEKLESLEIEARHLELEGELSSLEHLVPMLNHMLLNDHTTSMIEKWTKKSCFNNVTSLTMAMCSDGNKDGDGDVDLHTLILGAFPNLQKLNITVRYFEDVMSKIVLLMAAIKRLRYLRIVFLENGELFNSDVWDALLIGIPMDFLAALRESPDLWKGLETPSKTSIRNLTELETLEFNGKFPNDFIPMSLVAYYFGIFKLPKLSKLILEGAFFREQVNQLAAKWQLENHVISVEGEVITREEKTGFPRNQTRIAKSSHFSIKTVLNSV